ncbi:MAG: hypothetical protein ABIP38_08070, partial [Steroidobacteraceae bacterium]
VWQRQYVVGSSIRQRSPPSLPEDHFDALIITEQHGVLNSLAWEHTPHHLRAWHDYYIARSPAGQTWFFMPWLSMDDPGNPARWASYEQAAAHVWQCAVSRINRNLRAEGRPDQIRVIPASLALVHLTQALQQEGGPAVFIDDVHLTPIAKFYMALVTASFMNGELPADVLPRILGATPESLSAADIRIMVRAALSFQAASRSRVELTESGCKRFLSESFIADYWDYYRDAILAKKSSALKARWSAWRMQQQSSVLLLEKL